MLIPLCSSKMKEKIWNDIIQITGIEFFQAIGIHYWPFGMRSNIITGLLLFCFFVFASCCHITIKYPISLLELVRRFILQFCQDTCRYQALSIMGCLIYWLHAIGV